MKIKTILLPIYNGIRAKNFFYTDIYKELLREGDIRIVIVIPPSKKEFYEKEFAEPNVIFEPLEIISEPRFGRILAGFAFSLLNTDSVRLKHKWWYLKYGGRVKYFLREAMNRIFSPFKFSRRFVRWFDRFVSLDPGVVGILKKYNPDIVLVPDIVFPPDRVFLRAAKRTKFFVVGMIRAWDNLTSKGVILVLPDKLAVHTNMLKRQAIKYTDMKEENIDVTGIPHYDIFFKERNMTREEFCMSLAIPPERRIVLCAPFLYGDTTSAVVIINELTRAIKDGRLPRDVQILVRYRPGTPPIKDGLLEPSENLSVTRPCSEFFEVKNTQAPTKDWEFTTDDINLLLNTLYYSDVTINSMSTLSIDAAIYDKPIINVRFDASPNVPPDESVTIFLKHTHYKSVEDSGGVRRVWNMKELIDSVKEYLDHPEHDREGRARILCEQIEFTDGLSGKRTAQYLRKLLF
ncbi:hypothetical protein HYT00_03490 [Candidatus Giovannonibacteria bacterium]|nr:hypothetical protein [Candidatus Giovannonibacteria bacterium]